MNQAPNIYDPHTGRLIVAHGAVPSRGAQPRDHTVAAPYTLVLGDGTRTEVTPVHVSTEGNSYHVADGSTSAPVTTEANIPPMSPNTHQLDGPYEAPNAPAARPTPLSVPTPPPTPARPLQEPVAPPRKVVTIEEIPADAPQTAYVLF